MKTKFKVGENVIDVKDNWRGVVLEIKEYGIKTSRFFYELDGQWESFDGKYILLTLNEYNCKVRIRSIKLKQSEHEN